MQALIGIGGTPDSGAIAWYARLSEHQPTLKIRVADAQLEPSRSVLLAFLCRRLVAMTLDFPQRREPTPAPEFLDAAIWHAARHGLGRELVHPLQQTLVPAADVLESLVEAVAPALEASGDLQAVTAMMQHLRAAGSRAQQQRAAYASGGRGSLAGLFANSVTARPGPAATGFTVQE